MFFQTGRGKEYIGKFRENFHIPITNAIFFFKFLFLQSCKRTRNKMYKDLQRMAVTHSVIYKNRKMDKSPLIFQFWMTFFSFFLYIYIKVTHRLWNGKARDIARHAFLACPVKNSGETRFERKTEKNRKSGDFGETLKISGTKIYRLDIYPQKNYRDFRSVNFGMK